MAARVSQFIIVLMLISRTNVSAFAQQEANAVSRGVTVPRLIAFNGVLLDRNGQPLSGVVGVTFGLYGEQRGGAPIWVESQNVQVDPAGRYNILLGAATGDGLLMDLFTSGQSRWLGVQAQIPGEEEQTRVLLVSVPYALKAADADTVGGKPASAFVLNDEVTHTVHNSTTGDSPTSNAATSTITGTPGQIAKFAANGNDIENSLLAESGGNVGVGTTSPLDLLTVGAGGSGSNDAALRIDSGSGGGRPLLRFTRNNIANVLMGVASGPDSLTPGSISGDFVFRGQGQKILFTSTAGASTALAVDTNGNVGIGTPAPADLLTVGAGGTGPNDAVMRIDSGNTGGRPLLRFARNGTAYALMGVASGNDSLTAGSVAGDFVFRGQSQKILFTPDGSGTALAINTNGNVGIGTAAPSAKLDVSGTLKATTLVGDGSGLTNVNANTVGGQPASSFLTRGITYLAGCDACTTLQVTDDQKMIYVNLVGAMTINEIKCYSDAGGPTINLHRNGSANNILNTNMTCSNTGGLPGPTIVPAESVLSLNDTLDFEMATVDNIAKRLTVVIKTTIN